MRDEMTIRSDYYDEIERNFANIPTTTTNQFLLNINTYCRNLTELIKVFRTASQKLDNISMIAEFVNLLSSLASLAKNIDIIFNNEISSNLTNQAYDTNPVLGIISQGLWNCVPQSIYVKFFTSIGESLGTIWILRTLSKPSDRCKESMEEIKNYFNKSEEMNEEVKSLFFGEWDDKLVASIEKALSEEDIGVKMFAFLYVSALIVSPFMLQRFDFLKKIFIFSTSTLGQKWYKRNLIQDLFPKITLRTEGIDLIGVRELSKSSAFIDFVTVSVINILEPGSELTIKDRVQVKTKSATPYAYGALDCILIYLSCRKFKYGVSNKNSALLRNLAERAESRLREINSFMLRYVSRRLADF
nr:uncharacterized protein LOC107440753 isoform X2 [Parasteatoda tepidariorum]